MSSEQVKKMTKKVSEEEDIVLNETKAIDRDSGKFVVKKRTVSIEPYFDPETKFMGYEKYGYSGFPGGAETQDLGYLEVGYNSYKYLTGLDPFAKRIQMIKDSDERIAAIQEIEKTLSWLEDRGYNRELLDSSNVAFWSKRKHTFENNSRYDLDFNDPEDVLLYWSIIGGGYDVVATTLKEAKQGNKFYKWYLTELETEAVNKVEIKLIRNKARALLTDMYLAKPRILFYLSKNILSPDNFFKNSTPFGILYDKLDDFIEGKSLVTGKRDSAKMFIETINKSQEDLFLMAIVRDAIFFRVVKRRKDGLFLSPTNGSVLGKNEFEIFEHLKNPLFSSDYDEVERLIKDKWEN